MMKLIDSHCHLDDFFFEGKLDVVLKNAELALVDKMVAIGTHYHDWAFYENLCKKYSNICYTVGLHPLCITLTDKVEQLEENLTKHLGGTIRPVAVGEMGLDYHRLPEDVQERQLTIEKQKDFFRAQLAFAKTNNFPTIVHSRMAFADTLQILFDSDISADKTLFHCYDYGIDEMKTLREWGAFVSFSGMLTFKKKLIEPLKIADPQKILIETDSPYLTPEPYRGKTNEPSYIRAVAVRASQILNLSEQVFCDLTYSNTEKFFSLY